ncbi:MAG: hypothetical protein IMW89_06565 [Ktedonobacteraceae bacterium]|nr:hypothetical protein [Ktedonobacteraceae bacterium]
MRDNAPDNSMHGQPVYDGEAEWSHRNFGDQNFQEKKGFFAWWYRFTAPPDPPPGASFQQRDTVRRGRIASAIMLFLGSILLLVFPIGILTPNRTIAVVAVTVWAVILVSIPLNRRGHVIPVGILLSLSVNIGMYFSILTAPHGLSINDKDILYLLIFAELFIGAILPVNWVFLPAAVNILFSIWMLTFAPHNPATAQLLSASYSIIIFRVLQLHILVTGILWILGRYAQQAIMRADQAEEVARLHRVMARQAQAAEEQRQALENGKVEIVTALQRFANGDGNARASLPGGHALWLLASTVNNLLSRLQRLRIQELEAQQRLYPRLQQLAQMEQEKRRAQMLAQEVSEAIRQAEQSGQPLHLPALTGTAFADVFAALNGKYVVTRSTIEKK